MKISVSSPIIETPRVLQARGMFDLAEAKTSSVEWDVSLPLHEKSWHIGLVVGPSGCGKSTIAKRLWPETPPMAWSADQSILDAFPEALSIKQVTEILSSVGFASPPAWLRPFHVLSTGQQFRVQLARLIAENVTAAFPKAPIVVDEFTSVVDRTVAQIGSAAFARTVRKKGLQFVAVSCHEDVEAWLQPDWVYRPAEQRFSWRFLQRRPSIDLEVVRCHPSAWPLFAPHHYLSGDLARSATCFLALWQPTESGAPQPPPVGHVSNVPTPQPVAFSAWLPFFGAGPPARREHRTVTLPDYQGVGIGNALSALIAGMWKTLGYRAVSTTTHPAMIQARCASPLWRMRRRRDWPAKGTRSSTQRPA